MLRELLTRTAVSALLVVAVLYPVVGAWLTALNVLLAVLLLLKREENCECYHILHGKADISLRPIAVWLLVAVSTGACSYAVIKALSALRTYGFLLSVSAVSALLWLAERSVPKLRCRPTKVCICNGRRYFVCGWIRFDESGRSLVGEIELKQNRWGERDVQAEDICNG